jgi:hypothetical protein
MKHNKQLKLSAVAKPPREDKMTKNQMKQQNKWIARNYKRIELKLKNEIADKFKEKIKADGITVSGFLTQKVNEYLEGK